MMKSYYPSIYISRFWQYIMENSPSYPYSEMEYLASTISSNNAGNIIEAITAKLSSIPELKKGLYMFSWYKKNISWLSGQKGWFSYIDDNSAEDIFLNLSSAIVHFPEGAPHVKDSLIKLRNEFVQAQDGRGKNLCNTASLCHCHICEHRLSKPLFSLAKQICTI